MCVRLFYDIWVLQFYREIEFGIHFYILIDYSQPTALPASGHSPGIQSHTRLVGITTLEIIILRLARS
jgi:hypothetical protein